MMNYYLRNEEKTKAFGTILKLVAGSLLKLSVSATHSSLGHVYIGRWVDTTILKKLLNEKNKRGKKLDMDGAIHILTIQKADEIRPKRFSHIDCSDLFKSPLCRLFKNSAQIMT